MARFARHFALTAAFLSAVPVLPSAMAQSAPADNMVATRYDVARRVTGTIAPDPDGIGVGTIAFAATRNSYDSRGLLIKVESGELGAWQAETIAPANWTGFTIFRRLDTTYDVMGRKTKDVVTAGGVIEAVTQYSYTPGGKLECTAQRMNKAVFASLSVSACALGPEGAQGKDRITKNIYDMGGRLGVVQRAVGTPRQQNYVTYTYTASAKPRTITDANGTTATYDYDGHDRLKRWRFPSKVSAGVSSADDYEEYSYDLGGRRTSLRKRDGSVINFIYDALGRVTSKTVPGRTGLPATHSRDVHYGYDLRGLQMFARFDNASGEGVSFAYDNHGRPTSTTQVMGGASRTLTYQWNSDGLRTRVTRPDGNYTAYGYDGLDRLLTIHNGTTQLVLQSYNNKSELTGRTLPNASSTLTYDTLSRPTSLSHDMAGTGGDLIIGYGYNVASQMISRSRNNDAYVYGGDVNIARRYNVNGLNQYISTSTGAVFCYDANGNLTADGTSVFLYDVENRLVEARAQQGTGCPTATSGYGGALRASLRYDPLGRLYETNGSAGITRFEYDGDELVAEYASNGTILRRYTHGVGADDPVIWFEGAAMGSNRQLLFADHQGSIVSVANASGGLTGVNRYDEWGVPQAGNLGKFQYTGQLWLPELGMYYYKARIYSPTLGRFMQTDPIGYKDQMNLYAYVGNDPVNLIDPDGAYTCAKDSSGCEKRIEMYRKSMKAVASSYSPTTYEARAIRAGLRELGSFGEKGVVIRFADVKGPEGGHAVLYSDGTRGITLDNLAINGSVRMGAAILGHELAHTEQYRLRGEVSSYGDLYRRERNAYWFGGIIAGGLGLDSSSGMPVSTQVGFKNAVIERGKMSCRDARSEDFIKDWKLDLPGKCP